MLPARLFAVVEVGDALSRDRPDCEAWKRARVIDHLRAQTGTHSTFRRWRCFFR